MKLQLTFVAAAIFAAGCISQHDISDPTGISQRENRILLLDNSGGYSHPGRRIELLEDGVVIDTRYSDVIGDETVSRGVYILNNGDGIIKLRFGDRGNQELIRVPHEGEVYWVYPNEVKAIKTSDNDRMRQLALKQKGEQGRARATGELRL